MSIPKISVFVYNQHLAAIFGIISNRLSFQVNFFLIEVPGRG